MPGALHFLEVAVLQCDDPSLVIDDVHSAVVTQIKETHDTEQMTFWLLKIVGENRILAIVEDAAEQVLRIVNRVAGKHTHVTCKALHPYDSFAQNCLGLAAADCVPVPTRLPPGGRLFFRDCQVHYKGHTMEELLKAWRDEAAWAMKDLKEGAEETASFTAFKVVGSNRVLLLMRLPNTSFDDYNFQAPLIAQLGDNCDFPAWEVINLLSK